MAAVTGDDADNLVVCQMAKHHFDVPRTIARVNNPRNEFLFRHLGVDEIISPTRMVLAAIEQDIPVHELLHLANLEGGELELLEAQIADDSPALGRRPSDIALPEGCTLFVVIRDDKAQSVRPETDLPGGRQGHRHLAHRVRERPAHAAHRRRPGDRLRLTPALHPGTGRRAARARSLVWASLDHGDTRRAGRHRGRDGRPAVSAHGVTGLCPQPIRGTLSQPRTVHDGRLHDAFYVNIR